MTAGQSDMHTRSEAIEKERGETVVRPSLLAVAATAGCCMVAAFGLFAPPAQAQTTSFDSPAFAAVTPTPSAWRFGASNLSPPFLTTGFGVMYNIVTPAPGVNSYRELIFPLTWVLQALGAHWAWNVSLDAGGSISGATPVSCRLYGVGEGMIIDGTAVTNLSSPGAMALSLTTLCTSAYVDCSVPGNAWIGNVRWDYTPHP
jgi:hypothetical protein